MRGSAIPWLSWGEPIFFCRKIRIVQLLLMRPFFTTRYAICRLMRQCVDSAHELSARCNVSGGGGWRLLPKVHAQSYAQLLWIFTRLSAVDCVVWGLAAAGTVFAPCTNEAFCRLDLSPAWSQETGYLASIWQRRGVNGVKFTFFIALRHSHRFGALA